VRVLCSDCSVSYDLATDLVSDDDGTVQCAAGTSLRKAVGCAKCHQTGYRGRTGIFEVLEIAEDVRDLIKARAPKRDYREPARRAGLVNLREVGIRRAIAGITTLDEVLRVT
jgi:general secretion pathway protein E/type IV pilus assembly protein PilB